MADVVGPALAAALAGVPAAAADWRFEATAATHTMSKWVGKSGDGPQLAGRVERVRGDWRVGAWIGGVETSQGAFAETHLYVRGDARAGLVELAGTAFLKSHPGTDADAQDTLVELQMDATWSVADVEVRHRVEVTPDGYADARQAWWVETQATRPMTERVSLIGGIGVREQVGGQDYTAWSAGVVAALTERLTLDVRWFGNDGPENQPRYRERLVAELVAAF